MIRIDQTNLQHRRGDPRRGGRNRQSRISVL